MATGPLAGKRVAVLVEKLYIPAEIAAYQHHFGNLGADELYGGKGYDLIYGGFGNDLLDGDVGDDVLHGDAGSDTLSGGPGADLLSGGPGNDLYLYRPGDGDDQVLDREGVNRLLLLQVRPNQVTV